MRKQYKYLIIIIMLLQFSLTGCGPGTEEGLGFSTLEKFKENFVEYMAYPSYIPFEFDTIENIRLNVYANYNDKGFKSRKWLKYTPKKKYNRIDIFRSITLGYSKNISKNNQIYELIIVYYSLFPELRIEEIYPEHSEFIEYAGHTIYYGETIDSELIYPDKTYLEGDNKIYLNYFMNFDNKVYKFLFIYNVKEGTEKEKILEIRDKVKYEALDEAVKSYESLRYENKD